MRSQSRPPPPAVDDHAAAAGAEGYSALYEQRGKNLATIFSRKCRDANVSSLDKTFQRVLRRFRTVDQQHPQSQNDNANGVSRRLSLRKIPCDTASFQIALECIALAHGITTVDLSQTDLTLDALDQACHFISQSPTVVTVSVSGNPRLGWQGARSLADLVQHTKITRMEVDGCGFTDEQVRRISSLCLANATRFFASSEKRRGRNDSSAADADVVVVGSGSARNGEIQPAAVPSRRGGETQMAAPSLRSGQPLWTRTRSSDAHRPPLAGLTPAALDTIASAWPSSWLLWACDALLWTHPSQSLSAFCVAGLLLFSPFEGVGALLLFLVFGKVSHGPSSLLSSGEDRRLQKEHQRERPADVCDASSGCLSDRVTAAAAVGVGHAPQNPLRALRQRVAAMTSRSGLSARPDLLPVDREDGAEDDGSRYDDTTEVEESEDVWENESALTTTRALSGPSMASATTTRTAASLALCVWILCGLLADVVLSMAKAALLLGAFTTDYWLGEFLDYVRPVTTAAAAAIAGAPNTLSLARRSGPATDEQAGGGAAAAAGSLSAPEPRRINTSASSLHPRPPRIPSSGLLRRSPPSALLHLSPAHAAASEAYSRSVEAYRHRLVTAVSGNPLCEEFAVVCCTVLSLTIRGLSESLRGAPGVLVVAVEDTTFRVNVVLNPDVSVPSRLSRGGGRRAVVGAAQGEEMTSENCSAIFPKAGMLAVSARLVVLPCESEEEEELVLASGATDVAVEEGWRVMRTSVKLFGCCVDADGGGGSCSSSSRRCWVASSPVRPLDEATVDLYFTAHRRGGHQERRSQESIVRGDDDEDDDDGVHRFDPLSPPPVPPPPPPSRLNYWSTVNGSDNNITAASAATAAEVPHTMPILFRGSDGTCSSASRRR